MKMNRIKFLAILSSVVTGTSKKELIEQSNCFVFSNKQIIAFNGVLFASIPFESNWKFAVVADDLIKLVSKFPDEEIGMEIVEKQLMVTGKKKRAGLTIQNEINLPIDELPKAGKWKKASKDLMANFILASRICQADSENYKVSHICVSENQIFSTDCYRFMRIKSATGLKRLLVPSSALLVLNDITLTKVSTNAGWLFLGCSETKSIYAIRCSDDDYLETDKIEEILEMDDYSLVIFPKEMKNVIDRALVMAKEDYNKLAKVSLTKKYVTVKTEKSTGWYEEKQPVKFKGDDLKINIGLLLLKGLLERTSKAKVCSTKIKMEKDGLEFVTALGE